jgi:hypothetical protein
MTVAARHMLSAPAICEVRRSRDAPKRASSEQKESLRPTAASRLRRQNGLSDLCWHSNELLRCSHELCNKLRNIHNAP